MMKLRAALIASAALFVASPAFAQWGGSPIITGGSFTAGGTANQIQYYGTNGQFAGFTMSGDCTVTVATGVLICGAPYQELQTFFTSTTGSASINIPVGVTPSAPNNGDVWQTSSGLFYRSGGVTIGPLAAGGSGCTVTGTTNGIVTYNGSGCTVSSTNLLQTPAASASGIYSNATLFTGGNGTTTFPYLYIDQGGTKPTNFSVNGSEFGINAPSGFTGNFIHLTVNGSSTLAFSVSSAGAVKGSSYNASSGYSLGAAVVNFVLATAPTVPAACFAASGSAITNSNGTIAFGFTVGATPASTCTLTLPAASHDWTCHFDDRTTGSIVIGQNGAASTTSVALTSYSRTTGTATAPTTADLITGSCMAY